MSFGDLVEVYTLLTALLVFFLRIHGEISTSFFNCVIVLMIALFHDTFLCSIILKTTISRVLNGKIFDCSVSSSRKFHFVALRP